MRVNKPEYIKYIDWNSLVSSFIDGLASVKHSNSVSEYIKVDDPIFHFTHNMSWASDSTVIEQ